MVVSLSRNFGHQAALTAALDFVSGDAVVLMDGDLQDAPETIPAFVQRFEQGYDVVYATRVSRKEGWYLRLCYFLFYRLQTLLSETRLPLDSGDFGLMSRRVVEQLRRMPEHHRYLRGLRSWVGFRQIGIPVERAERHSGPKQVRYVEAAQAGLGRNYLPSRSYRSVLPPCWAASAIGLSTLFAGYSLFAKILLSQSPRGFTALVFLITFLSGVLLLFLGIIGEYVGRIYEEIKARAPLYCKQELSTTTRLPRRRRREVEMQKTPQEALNKSV